jgi:RHS repeat-associated protein
VLVHNRFAMSVAATFFLLAANAVAGTLVFPPTSADNTHCGNDTVGNGCSSVRFNGGHFVTDPSGNLYVGGDHFSYCVSPIVGWTFLGGAATDVTVTMRNDIAPGEGGQPSVRDPNGEALQVKVTDYPDGPSPTITTTTQPFPNGETVIVHVTGIAINQLQITVVDAVYGGECYSSVSGTCASSWSVTAMSATQPIDPTVTLTIGRNTDGTLTAHGSYTFPSQSNPNERTLTLSLLPDGNDPGVVYFNQTALNVTGTFSQPLGRYDTDRMIRAVATACEGIGEAEASVSGCGECKGPAKSVGGPVRLFDGVMTYAETDPLPATLGSEFRREYSTGTSFDQSFGTGWTSIFDATALPLDANATAVRVVTENRTNAVFRQTAMGTWVQKWPKGGVAGTLTGNEQTGYVFRESGGSVVRTFGANHHLVRLTDVQRNRSVSVTYDANGRPTQVADERGNWSCTIGTTAGHVTSISVDGRPDLVWIFEYNGALLTAVKVGANAEVWRTYEYTNNRLSVVRDAAGSAIEQHDYDAIGRATSSLDATGDISNIQYPASDANDVATTTVQRADGSQATFEQEFAAGEVVTRRVDGGCSTCGSNDATATYDANGNVRRLQNGRGYVTESTYDASGRHLIQQTTAMVPNGCDPETDVAHCRRTSFELNAAALAQTAASQTTNYTYADLNWPGNPTLVTRGSVLQSNGLAAETFSYDAATGTALVHTVTGAIDATGTQESHTTTTALYGAGESAAFSPGGAFQSSWLTLPQPAGQRKSVDGPRTDVSDVDLVLYYPIDSSVPGSWRGRLAATRNAAGHITRFEDYDPFGHAATVIDPNGVRTLTTYDVLGRLLTTTTAAIAGCNTSVDPLCATDLTATRTYASVAGFLSYEQRPSGNRVASYAYDTRGRVISITRGTATAALERMEITYDPTTGKKTSEVLSAFQNNAWVITKSETYAYTSDGNLRSVTHSDGSSVTNTYLPDGTLSSVQDERHAAPNTIYAYDGANRPTTVTQTLSTAPGATAITRYAYDRQGNLTSVTDPNGNVTTYVVDDFGRIQRQTSPVSGVTTYSYDASGNVVATSDANGASSTRTYDALNRVTSSVTSRAGSSETVSWSYDDATAGNFGIGRLASMTDPTGSTVYQYERRGMLRNEAKTISGATYTTTYSYDANGNRSAIGYPSGLSAQTSFDFADRPFSMTAGATTIVSSATYLPFGPATSIAFGNGTTRTTQYDTRYRPLENKLSAASGTIADYTYGEDAAGNITAIHDAMNPAFNRDFGYDDLNRLTTANSGASLWGAGSYTYDAMGNMTASALGTAKTTSSSLVGTTPKLATVVENGVSRSVGYDAAGNETTVGSATFSYSPRNHVIAADASSYAYDARGVMTMATISVLSVSVSPQSVTGGGVASGTVTLSAPASIDTTVVLSSSNPASASVPANIVIPAGGLTGGFTVTTFAVVSTDSVTITAGFNQYSATTLLYVTPAQLSSFSVSPQAVRGGTSATGTVTLTGTAATGRVVNLSSNDSAVQVPASVTVAAGSASATFAITTTSGVANRTATITALLDGVSRTGTLALLDAEIASVTVSPSTILNGGSATGTVTLDGPAAGTLTVTLATSSGDASVNPNVVYINAGATNGTFTVNTNLQSVASRTVTISATHNAVVRQTTVTITPPWLTNFVINPAALIGGEASATGTATLNGPAPPGPYRVNVSSSNTSLVATPNPITYPINGTSGQTTILTNAVLSSTPVVVTATDPTGVSRSQTITLQPAPITIASVTLSPASITGSNSVTGTVTLTDVAPAGGIDVELRSSDPVNAYPGSYVHVNVASRTATFSVATRNVTVNVPVTISAIHSATTKNVTLNLLAPTATYYPTNCYLANSQTQVVLTGGTTTTGTVNLNNIVASGSVTVTLSSTNSAVIVPSSITIRKGAGAQTFTVTTSSVTSPVSATITATAGGVIQRVGSVIVLPPNGVALASVTVYPDTLPSGSFSTITVTLTGPAPSGGATVTLGGSRPNIVSLQNSSIIIPVGSSSGTTYANAGTFTGINRLTTITASYAGISRSTTLVPCGSLPACGDLMITAQPQASFSKRDAVQCASASVIPCLSALGTTTMTGAAAFAQPLATGDSTGYYLYTPELTLLAETSVSPDAAKPIAYSYLWFGGTPVAQVEASTNTTMWYFNDHLDTPLLQTGAAGNVVWRAEYTPYGDVYSLRAGASLHQPLRFPGQIAQDGSSLSYNIFRWFRAGWGRYTQADPMGLRGGINPYMYAGDNPLHYIDRNGLKAEIACANIGIFGLSWTPFVHCGIHVTCEKCDNKFVKYDSFVELSRNRQSPGKELAVKDEAMPGGYTHHYEIGGVDQNDSCAFGNCIKQLAALYAPDAARWTPQYSIFGPNSNSFAGHIMRTCGGQGPPEGPFGATAFNQPLGFD